MANPFICIAGKNNISVDILEEAIRRYGKESICIVCNRTETGENSFQKSLRKCAIQNGIEEKKLEEVYDIDNLVFLSLEFDKIIRPHLFKNARLYNIHFSMLPRYKGMYTSAHPILNGEKYTGVTLHKIDAGIDTGDIIDQERFEIEDTDDCKALYIKYIQHGTRVVLRNLDNLISGRVRATAQSFIDSSYYAKGSLDYSNLKVNLNQTAIGIARQVRAYSFRDYQLPVVYDNRIIDYRILNSKSFAKPGKVLLQGDNYLIISTVDFDMVLYYDRFDELMDACHVGDINLIKDICIVHKHVNDQDENGWSPLIKATYYNQIAVVKYLISIGADINVKNRNGTTLLMYAKEAYKKYKDATLFKLFVDMGLSVDENDYNKHNLRYYLEKDGLTIDELTE